MKTWMSEAVRQLSWTVINGQKMRIIRIPRRRVERALREWKRTGAVQVVWEGLWMGRRQRIWVVDEAVFERSFHVWDIYNADDSGYTFYLWRPETWRYKWK